jgi:DNA-binding winged helix-turn-helix (wHTH) protein
MILLYQIANHVIDVARNQIIRDQHSVDEFIQTLPPKTIMVLTELAKAQGNVVSHDQLMNVVWQNTVVSPNSIQRCITQLRKALADDVKLQFIIKTHAKQGYSLEVPVVFLQDTNQVLDEPAEEEIYTVKNNESHSNEINFVGKKYQSVPIQKLTSPKSDKHFTKHIISLVILIILIMVTYRYFSPSPRSFSFNSLTPITSSDNLERNASYSPDGKFILFHRYDGLCDNNIWTKELATGREHKLTKTYGFYSDHSFTENGETLAFMAKVSCGDKKKQNNKNECWNLMTLDFAKALKEPQQPELIVSCDQGALSNPIWLNNGNIVALNEQDSRWQIVKFMPGAPSYVPLYNSNDNNYYHLMYSSKRKALIALAINSRNEHVIDLISPQGKLLSSHIIERPSIISPYQLLNPIIDPQQDQLLFSTGKRLFSLSIDGKIEQMSTLSHNYLSNIKLNNSGESIVSVQGFIDTDITKVNIENFDPNQKPGLAKNRDVKFNQVRQPYPSIARSIAEDYDAKFQPNGELIAFISARSGTSQIWIQNQNQLTQLTHFPIDTVISGFSWSPKGSSIILAANSELFNVSLDKSINKISLGFAVLNFYQWQQNNELLMSVRQAGQHKVITYNLTSNKTTVLIKDEIKWAVNTQVNQLLHLDKNNIFWITTTQEAKSIVKLKDQFGSKRFIFENGNLYGINKHKQLWSYTLNTDNFKILGVMDSYTNFISDMRISDILLTQIISAKKEVVVLSNNSN